MRRQWILTGAALLTLLSILALVVPGREAVGAPGSVLSRGDRGWLAARRYLEARQAHVTLLDRRLEDPPPRREALALSFPWRRGAFETDFAAASRHLAAGGNVLLAYSGRASAQEDVALERLGLAAVEVRGRPPLRPWLWREYVRAEWRLEADPSLGADLRTLSVPAPSRVPQAPSNARILYRGERGTPAVFFVPRGRGELWVMPAAAFANAWLAKDGNADLLEMLRVRLGERWSFDEYHHGLVAADTPLETANARVMGLWMAHLVLAYLLGLLALARRFGPAWDEPAPIASSVAAYLRGLGALHDRLGHHREAARLLPLRAAELDARLAWPRQQLDVARDVDAAQLVALGRAVARRQAHGGVSK